MNVMSQLWNEVAQEVLASEATILLRLVRQRIGELTLGELKDLLASPAGRRLHGRCLEELFSAGNDASPPRERRSKPEQVAQAVLAVLHASTRPLRASDLLDAVGCTPPQLYGALRLLRELGQVLLVDPAPRPTYWAQPGGAYRTLARAPRHAGQVLDALQGSDGTGLTLRELSASTGLSDEQVRRVLAYLMNCGQVLRTGRSISTRYLLARSTKIRGGQDEGERQRSSRALVGT